MRINRHDTNGVKALLATGELGYDNYPAGGDDGRVYVGTGSANIAQAKKAEVVAVDGKVDAHVARVDNPHTVTKVQVGLGNVDNTADSSKVVASAGKWTTGRLINGSAVDGTANIITSQWGVSRNITIGNSSKNVDGAGNVSWTLNEIGAIGPVSPAFTGIPTASTAAVNTNTTQLATTAFVNAEIANDAVPRVTSTDNAIVRFDGTTGSVQDSAITIDDNGNMGSGAQSFNGFGGTGFKNYIINGKKVVNQRALTLTDNSYNQDRWYKAGNNWYQGIEGDNNLIGGKKYTLSWVGNATASYYVGNATINAQTFTAIANGGNFTLTISAGQDLWIKFASDTTGSTFNFVQLEEGTIATPFENRPIGLELSLCQRYYEIGFIKSWGVATAPTQSMGHTQSYKVTKRIVPTVTFTNSVLNNVTAIASENANQTETLLAYANSIASGTYAYQASFIADAEI